MSLLVWHIPRATDLRPQYTPSSPCSICVLHGIEFNINAVRLKLHWVLSWIAFFPKYWIGCRERPSFGKAYVCRDIFCRRNVSWLLPGRTQKFIWQSGPLISWRGAVMRAWHERSGRKNWSNIGDSLSRATAMLSSMSQKFGLAGVLPGENISHTKLTCGIHATRHIATPS